MMVPTPYDWPRIGGRFLNPLRRVYLRGFERGYISERRGEDRQRSFCPHPEKRQYQDRKIANQALADILRKRPDAGVKRSYGCQCGHFHLTSSGRLQLIPE